MYDLYLEKIDYNLDVIRLKTLMEEIFKIAENPMKFSKYFYRGLFCPQDDHFKLIHFDTLLRYIFSCDAMPHEVMEQFETSFGEKKDEPVRICTSRVCDGLVDDTPNYIDEEYVVINTEIECAAKSYASAIFNCYTSDEGQRLLHSMINCYLKHIAPSLAIQREDICQLEAWQASNFLGRLAIFFQKQAVEIRLGILNVTGGFETVKQQFLRIIDHSPQDYFLEKASVDKILAQHITARKKYLPNLVQDWHDNRENNPSQLTIFDSLKGLADKYIMKLVVHAEPPETNPKCSNYTFIANRDYDDRDTLNWLINRSIYSSDDDRHLIFAAITTDKLK